MYRVAITDSLWPPISIEEEILANFASVQCLTGMSPDPWHDAVVSADALIVYHEVSITRDLIGQLGRCRVIVRGGIGYDNIDVQAARERGIPVCNIPDYGVDEVADHTICLMLACQRGLMLAERHLRQSLTPWDRRAIPPVERLSTYTLGIIGAGRMGSAVAIRARALKMRVLVCDPYLRPGMEKVLDATRVNLSTLLAESDIVTLHTPLNDETRHLINARALSAMKPNAILINTARGAVVDTEALARALRNRQIAGAAIDVLPQEPPDPASGLIQLWQDEKADVNLIITPHVAYYSEAATLEIRVKGAQEVARVLRGERPLNCVNLV